MSTRRFIAFAATLLIASQAIAFEPELRYEAPPMGPATSTIGQGHRVSVIPLAGFRSEPGESLDSFALRLALWFHNFTSSTNYEACGQIGRSASGEFGVVVTTSHAQIGCANADFYLDGFEPTGETIHSHPVLRRFVAKGNDRAFMNAAMNTTGKRAPLRFSVTSRGHTFSQADYESGPGYLVVHGRLLHQRGRGTVREVSVLPSMEVAMTE